VRFFYLWLPSVEVGDIAREERVLRGGHDISIGVIRRRSVHSGDFWNYCRPAADEWTLFRFGATGLWFLHSRQVGDSNSGADHVQSNCKFPYEHCLSLKFLPYRSKSELPWPCRRPLRKRLRNPVARGIASVCVARWKSSGSTCRRITREDLKTNSTCWGIKVFWAGGAAPDAVFA